MKKGLMCMFRSFRFGRRALAITAAVCLLLILCGGFLILRTGAPDMVTAGEEELSLRIADDSDVEEFIREAGCEVEGMVSDERITVPKNWNERYEAYQQLQLEQGFDLVPYKGQQARKLVYVLCDSDDRVTILSTDERIIAADISAADGSRQRALFKKERS